MYLQVAAPGDLGSGHECKPEADVVVLELVMVNDEPVVGKPRDQGQVDRDLLTVSLCLLIPENQRAVLTPLRPEADPPPDQ